MVEELELGDHVALFYRNRTEQLRVMIPYIKLGLKKNERCLYIADDNSVPLILRRLEEAGVDVDDAQRRGALVVTTKCDTYLRHGVFEPARMLSDLKEAVRQSLAMGFAGLRASGEMSWALDLPSAVTSLLDYEMSLDNEYPGAFMALCQYDETRFPEAIVREMAALHPVVIQSGRLTRNRPRSQQSPHPVPRVPSTLPASPAPEHAIAAAAN